MKAYGTAGTFSDSLQVVREDIPDQGDLRIQVRSMGMDIDEVHGRERRVVVVVVVVIVVVVVFVGVVYRFKTSLSIILGKYSYSSSCTLAASVSGVSEGLTGQVVWKIVLPRSYSRLT
jgi:hypothetical protein